MASEIREVLEAHVRRLESATGTTLDSRRRPLIVSVRSGAPVSMPGMLETILNVGLTDRTVDGLIRRTGVPRLAWDCYRRLIEGFAAIVHDIPSHRFRALNEAATRRDRVPSVRELDAIALAGLVNDAKAVFREAVGRDFPQDPLEQLSQSAISVFRSWYGEKAATFRAIHGIPDDIGTAVLVQQMVFGNAGGASGSGVAFTRNPASGADELFVDFVHNGQGEDVVGGREGVESVARLAAVAPDAYQELVRARGILERIFGDMQDLEFTVERGTLYMLQSRPGKRTPRAGVQIALDLHAAGIISADTARRRVSEYDPNQLVQTRLDPGTARPLVRAMSASLGVGGGPIALDSESAFAFAREGRPAVLVRRYVETDDIEGLAAAVGLLTATGGRTSHAAVVARQLGKVCLVACPELAIDLPRRRCRIGRHRFREGDVVTLDGQTGDVYAGEVGRVSETPTALLDGIERLLDTPKAHAGRAE